MDEVIFEEFKGTGNSEIILDRKLVRQADLPGDRHHQVGHPQGRAAGRQGTISKMWVLRRILMPMGVEAMDFLIDKPKHTKSNSEFFDSMNQ